MTASRARFQQKMVAHVLRLAPDEGYNRTELADVRLLRANASLPHTPVLYEPCIMIVCQGRKRGFLGRRTYLYDAQHYLVLSVPLPFISQTEATKKEPLLALSIRLDLTMLADLLLALERALPVPDAMPVSMVSTEMGDELADTVLRLLRALERPLEAHALGAGLLREIYYRVLVGEQGPALRAALTQRDRFGQIARAIRKIQTSFHEHLEVADLAREANMSLPSFHKYFRTITQSTPIQYLKSTRLHQARLLMIRSGLSAVDASARVGYESPSQFSREFKRLFGQPPMEEARRMRNILRVKAESVWQDFLPDRE
ncbi:AraC family transcriptional regulator [Paraburkholderia silvatlantica]|uniref:AraC-like DNA-binding protein n=1 Tax=Paraburkholderia silvatlantica TaxID=321895 RepID=A0ABR6FXZ0_9BURK|nr:AraC family transcriptional regulator [Paraburkholderia silvatlantica]MBB2931982.1 AraC-like DNA-binding protein [Paraburkholderia silvatlantica]PVY24657.1 AraC-like DNA-binding protein [Paraburkholderia silvatlantica]PXW31153.1 AraC-like DNA-binding protein [Paraburkholderia silvatlantica]